MPWRLRGPSDRRGPTCSMLMLLGWFFGDHLCQCPHKNWWHYLDLIGTPTYKIKKRNSLDCGGYMIGGLGFISAVESWMSTLDGRNPAPVEVGSLSHYLQGFSTIPGGDRRISEPSTVAFNFWFKFGLMLSIPGPIINI